MRFARVVPIVFGLLAPGGVPGAAQWVEPAGQGWASLSVYRLSTDRVFAADGSEVPFPLQGRTTALSSFTTVDVGLGHGLDSWVQLSFHRLVLRDLTAIRRSTGLGDLRVYGRWSPSHTFGWSLPVALRGGVKLPIGDFEGADGLIPLGDGQPDVELVAEVGWSFWPVDAYAMGWLGYRWRRARSDTGFDFGDERFFLLGGGARKGRLGARLLTEGWFGREVDRGGLASRPQARRLVRVSPSVTVRLGRGEVELGTRVPLSGRNLPAGSELTIAYFVRW